MSKLSGQVNIKHLNVENLIVRPSFTDANSWNSQAEDVKINPIKTELEIDENKSLFLCPIFNSGSSIMLSATTNTSVSSLDLEDDLGPSSSLVLDMLSSETNRLALSHGTQSFDDIKNSIFLSKHWNHDKINEPISNSILISNAMTFPTKDSIIIESSSSENPYTASNIINIGTNLSSKTDTFGLFSTSIEASVYSNSSLISIGSVNQNQSSVSICIGAFNSIIEDSNTLETNSIIIGSQNQIYANDQNNNLIVGQNSATASKLTNATVIGHNSNFCHSWGGLEHFDNYTSGLLRINPDPTCPSFIDAVAASSSQTNIQSLYFIEPTFAYWFFSDVKVKSLIFTDSHLDFKTDGKALSAIHVNGNNTDVSMTFSSENSARFISFTNFSQFQQASPLSQA